MQKGDHKTFNKSKSCFSLRSWFLYTGKNNYSVFHDIVIPTFLRSRKGQMYTLLLDGGLVKRYPWRIWVIIDASHPACHKRRLGGAWMVVRYKSFSNKTQGVVGLGPPNNQQSCSRWCAWVLISPPPRTLQGMTTLPVSESAVPNNGKVENTIICPLSRCFGSYFDAIFLMYIVFSGFSFKPTSSSSIILIDPV